MTADSNGSASTPTTAAKTPAEVVKEGADVNLGEIEALLNSNSDQVGEQFVSIIRTTEIGRCTVSLFATFGSEPDVSLKLAGTGTLVVFGDEHYILTAEHVWEKILKFAVGVGIPLREVDDHRFFMNISTIVPFGPRNDGGWSEWGPDLVLLRIPPFHVGAIRAFKDFYNLSAPTAPRSNTSRVETEILMGTPHVAGDFTNTHASVEIMGFPGPIVQQHTKNGFDYLDVKASLGSKGLPNEFGGVSGGGLWTAMFYENGESNQIDVEVRLEGVAFYQLEDAQDGRIIRCHGPESIKGAVPKP